MTISQQEFVTAENTVQMVSMALVGTLTATGERAVVVGFDLARLVHAEQSKQQQEMAAAMACLGNLREDVRSGDIRLVPGPNRNDPPDVVARVFGKVLNVEVAQVHLPDRQGGRAISAYKRFEGIRADLLKKSLTLGRVYRKHQNTMVLVWFGDGEINFDAPVPASPEALLQLLRDYAPPPDQSDLPGPTSNPSDFVKWSDDRSTGMSWGALLPNYPSPFRTATGFDIGLASNRTVKESDMCAELVRIVEQHDNPVNDLLIVSTNAPLRSGLYFNSSAPIAQLLFDAPDPLLGWRPRHLKDIVLHNFKEPTKFRWLVGSNRVLV